MSAAPRLAEIARRLGQLRPDWSNPERYFENRSELERDMRRLAKQLEREHG
ncbi:hypothetical protein [Sphingomonas sp. HMP6]|uniref:hypothetical protein n=1 Tax=Sphingomonas sp. HMP6 TaxID=1517551 RepID=UPI0015964327|nr:hypothetical protein [Sphingomonas sp. HMP6]BCA60049.1 hypothetical protein NX02_29245 [Sphingomonas sp. HMP6]